MVSSLAPTIGKFDQNLGGWTGIIGELQRNELDFVLMNLAILRERAQADYLSLSFL